MSTIAEPGPISPTARTGGFFRLLRKYALQIAIVLVLLGFWATEKVLHDFDTSSTTIAAIALMLLPRLGVMDWKESQQGFPWGTVVLFAVGIVYRAHGDHAWATGALKGVAAASVVVASA